MRLGSLRVRAKSIINKGSISEILLMGKNMGLGLLYSKMDSNTLGNIIRMPRKEKGNW